MAWDPISLTPPQYVDSNGDPYSGSVLKFYAAGTTTNIVLATDSTGGTTATDVALNSDGFPEISGNTIIPHIDQAYKIALYPTQAAADADSGADWTVDNLSTGISGEEWTDSNDTPTRVNGYTFTVPGDETSKYHVGRRLKITHGGGTDYFTVAVSTYTSLTTVEVAGTNNLLDPIVIELSILRADFTSIPQEQVGSATAAATVSMPTASMIELTGGSTITRFQRFESSLVETFRCANDVTLTHDGDFIDVPGSQDLVIKAGESFTAYQYDQDSTNAKVRIIGHMPTRPSSIARFASGSYTGDGSTSQAITGLGFQPKIVWIQDEQTVAGGVNIRMTWDSIIDDNAAGIATNVAGGTVVISAIISLDADGFTVDDGGTDSTPNTNGTTYKYFAIG